MTLRPTDSLAGLIALNALFFGALALFAYLVYRRYIIVSSGKSEVRTENVPERVRGVLQFALGQWRMVRDPLAGVMHILVFWGFCVIGISTINMIGRGFKADFQSPLMDTAFGAAYASGLDLFETLVLAGIIGFAIRRYVLRPSKLHNNADAAISLSLIAGLMVSDILVRASQIAHPDLPSSGWTPMAALVGGGLGGLETASLRLVHHAFWWAHISLILAFLVYLPISKHFHVFTAVINVFLRRLRPQGQFTLMDLEGAEEFGAQRVEHLTWKQIFDVFTCTECGRCQDQCPAWESQKPLSVKQVNIDLRQHVMGQFDYLARLHRARRRAPGGEGLPEYQGPSLIGGVIAEDTVWSCTMCGYCEEMCPVFIEHIDRTAEMRRFLVLSEGKLDSNAATSFRNIEVNGNPYGFSWEDRARWAEGLGVEILADGTGGDIEYLYYVGCAGSFDDRNKAVSRAVVKILNAAGVRYAILGKREKCCGDPARRIGNEYLYQMVARENVETFKNLNVKKIITACPHCFHTIRNEYPQLGGAFEVVHHSEVIADLLRQGRIHLGRPLDQSITYHDSCYLGRFNGNYDAPREILKSLPGTEFKEMRRIREKSFCCGGGGGHMWMDVNIGRRINHIRVEEALETGQQVAATACPFCLSMFEDGIKAHNATNRMITRDFAELVAQAMEEPAAQPQLARISHQRS